MAFLCGSYWLKPRSISEISRVLERLKFQGRHQDQPGRCDIRESCLLVRHRASSEYSSSLFPRHPCHAAADAWPWLYRVYLVKASREIWWCLVNITFWPA